MDAELIRMRDSRFSTAKFLGDDESLIDLIKIDRVTLEPTISLQFSYSVGKPIFDADNMHQRCQKIGSTIFGKVFR